MPQGLKYLSINKKLIPVCNRDKSYVGHSDESESCFPPCCHWESFRKPYHFSMHIANKDASSQMALRLYSFRLTYVMQHLSYFYVYHPDSPNQTHNTHEDHPPLKKKKTAKLTIEMKRVPLDNHAQQPGRCPKPPN